MQINNEIFMLVAEELSIGRAAQRAFVTQQCVSDHIKRLEQQYGVRLFTRKPRFQLTEHGRELLRAFQQIKQIEQQVQERMEKRAQGERGSFTMGISASRSPVVLPWVLPKYYGRFPEVEIRFLRNDTMLLEQSLKKGEIDLFLGVNSHYYEGFDYTLVCMDEICVILSEGLLRRTLGDNVGIVHDAGINLRLLERLPFVKSYTTSAVNHLMENYMNSEKIRPSFLYQISDTDTQISLCADGICAAFVPKMLLARVPAHNRACRPEQVIHVLSLAQAQGFDKQLRIELVSRAGQEKPAYVRAFEQMLIQTVDTQYIKKWDNRQEIRAF